MVVLAAALALIASHGMVARALLVKGITAVRMALMSIPALVAVAPAAVVAAAAVGQVPLVNKAKAPAQQRKVVRAVLAQHLLLAAHP
jgi:hypothetical protein